MSRAPSGEAQHGRSTRFGFPVPEAPGGSMRGPLLLSAARTLGNATTVVVLYYLLPLNRTVSWRTVGWLAGGLVLLGLLVAWQIRAVLQSRYPSLRALEALATSIPLFLFLFAAVYQLIAGTDPGAFSEPMTRTDTVYFVVTVFATVGFGDITAVSETARVLVTVQMLGDLVLIGLVIRAFLAAAGRGRDSRERERRAAAGRDGPSREE